MFENIQKKRPNAPKHRDGGPTKNLLPERKEASGKTCRHNLTGYISPSQGANEFLLGRFPSHLLKYSGIKEHRLFAKTAFLKVARILSNANGFWKKEKKGPVRPDVCNRPAGLSSKSFSAAPLGLGRPLEKWAEEAHGSPRFFLVHIVHLVLPEHANPGILRGAAENIASAEAIRLSDQGRFRKKSEDFRFFA